ncbi:MAG TPA: HAMP domain-containing sensor histidine kinase [Caulobacteraceae bacterium]|nr:HAMP domain-containing sensor histidine kinase [Caulobacteraceae bacterium]
MLRSASLRLAALYTAAFAAAVIVLGAVTLVTTRTTLSQQFDARIQSESAALVREFRTEGLTGVVQAVQERDSTPGALDYGLQGPDGRPIAGRLAQARASPGWSEQRISQFGHEKIRTYAASLAGGYRLLVGGDDESIEAVDNLLAERFSLAILGVVVIGLVGGYGLSRGMGRRIAAITGAAEAIIDGDLSRRVPAAPRGDDLGRLAATFNRMLDRIGALMESLRQVSSDIAHDMRTPLTRLRSRLEASLQGPPGPAQAAAIEAALGDLDAILETFAALLRIAQIESGARRAAFQTFDLCAVARTVVDAFAPSAEEAGQRLTLEDGEPVVVDGDRELLTQMLVNLVENGLRHAGGQAQVTVRCRVQQGRAVLSVTDDGPGVPDAERERLFDRFHRLEASRSTAGSGLGLALVAAVAKLHGAEASLRNADPGLEAAVAFPRRS